MSRILGCIAGCEIIEADDGVVHYRACGHVDADGANGQHGGLPAYAPSSYSGLTLDNLANAGHPGNWFGIVTHNGESDGEPVIQGASDPRPGAYVSATSLHLFGPKGEVLENSNPWKYVDAATVPFIVVPPLIPRSVGGIVLGCLVRAINTRNGRMCEGVAADIGPEHSLGEISAAMAMLLGVPSSARNGGEDACVIDYEIHPGQPAVINGVTYPLQRF